MRRIVLPVIVDLRDKSGRWYRYVHVKDLKSAPTDTTPIDEADDSTSITADESASLDTDNDNAGESEDSPESEDEGEITTEQ